MTVSRVINGRADVAPATRTAVLAAVEATGYRPSAVARSLVNRRSQMLGVITAGIRFVGVGQTLAAISDEAERSSYGLLVRDVGGVTPPDLRAAADYLVEHRVEAIIVAAPDLGPGSGEFLDRVHGLPPIVLLRARVGRCPASIRIDNVGGGRLAVDHLVALGHRRIGHIAGPAGWHEGADRLQGWRGGLEAAGLTPGAMVAGDWSSASGAAAFETLLGIDPRIDALFVANDQMALGVLRVARERGIRVPNDLAVVGFDGIPETADFSPPLTTICQPLERLGREAVRQALAAIRDEPRERHILLPTELITRASSLAAAYGEPGPRQMEDSRTQTNAIIRFRSVRPRGARHVGDPGQHQPTR